MKDVLCIAPVGCDERDGLQEWSVRLIRPDGEDFRLWYRFPVRWRDRVVTDRADAFLVPCVLYAMQNGWDVHVRGEVTPGLVRRLYEFQQVWACWRPGVYHPVEIQARESVRAPARNDRLLSMFSGGLDSCFTVWQYLQDNRPVWAERLDAVLMVHGLDIPLADAAGFAAASQRNREMLDGTGVELITCATNFRDLPLNWEDAHATALAGCLHLLSGRHRAALIPSSHCYDSLRMVWGSNPISDPLLSSDALDIRYDGAGWTRPGKAAAIMDWPAALRLLRVCWEGPAMDRNCGHCSKCVGTALAFAAQRLPIPAALPVPDLAAAVRALATVSLDAPQQLRIEELLAMAAEHGVDDEWVRETEAWLRCNQQPPARRWWSLRRRHR
jgi:hypothetical protein